MQKVLNIVPYPFLPYFSGGQKLIAHFNQFLGKKCKLYVAGTSDNIPDGKESYHFLPSLMRSKVRYIDLTAYFRIRKIILANGIDTLIIEHPYLGWLGWMLKSTTSVKLIYHTHNVEFARFRSLGKFWWPLLKIYERMTLGNADIVCCISKEDRNHFIHELKIPTEKCIVVPYGILQQQLPENKSALKAAICNRHGLDPEKQLLFFNGLLDYAPNTQALNNIVEKVNPLLQQSGLAYEILIAGKRLPAYFNELKNLNKENIHYAGFVEDIDAYTAAADLLLNPIMTGGGVKTKVIEAIGLNTSVVSTRSGAIGIDMQLCGDKISIVEDGDWNAFAEKVIAQLKAHAQTPSVFYEQFYWGNIIDRFVAH